MDVRASRPPWDAIVLAGGRGRRLGGSDKALVELRGATLLSLTLEAVADAHRTIVVGDVDAPGCVVVQERPRFAGPAAAIAAGVDHVTAAYVAVIACDHPFVGEAVDALLGAAMTGVDGAVGMAPDGRRQHLMAVVRTAALRGAVREIPDVVDLSVRRLMASLDLAEVQVSTRAAIDVDTWHDRDTALMEGSRDG